MKNKKIIVGVTGGIAAYKTAELVRMLVKAGCETSVAMTRNATKFITPLTFETLSGERVVWDMFNGGSVPLDHIVWAQVSDLILVAPATANFIAKVAHGIADDFLSTLIVAATAKILLCPSMNSQMYLNPSVGHNLEIIKSRGIAVMEPGEGELACHTQGPGRLPDPEDIFEYANIMLAEQDFLGVKILVTAGPTMEPIDPVRYITNRSSGRMGYAIARAARRRGAKVTLVSGPTALRAPSGVDLINVKTTREMRQAVMEKSVESDVIIKAAAVSDYRPRESNDQKIKKASESISVDLVQNPDILQELGHAKGKNCYLLVGFAAETQDLIANAAKKLEKKNLDMIVANDVSREDAGFESENNVVKILYRNGRQEELPMMTKDDLADRLLDRINLMRKK